MDFGQRLKDIIAGLSALSGQVVVLTSRVADSVTDRSTTLTAGDTAQDLMAADPERIGWFVQNASTSVKLWVNDQAEAVKDSPSIELGPGETYETPAGYDATSAVSVIGPSTGQKITARSWERTA